MKHLIQAIVITGLLAGCATTENTGDAAKPAAAPAKSGSVFSKVGLCSGGGGSGMGGQSLSSSSGIGGKQASGLGGCSEDNTKSQAKRLKMNTSTQTYDDDQRQKSFMERANVTPGSARNTTDDDDDFPVTRPPLEE